MTRCPSTLLRVFSMAGAQGSRRRPVCGTARPIAVSSSSTCGCRRQFHHTERRRRDPPYGSGSGSGSGSSGSSGYGNGFDSAAGLQDLPGRSKAREPEPQPLQHSISGDGGVDVGAATAGRHPAPQAPARRISLLPPGGLDAALRVAGARAGRPALVTAEASPGHRRNNSAAHAGRSRRQRAGPDP